MATILLVDDDAEVLERLVAIVQSVGHRAIAVESGTAALDVLDGDVSLDLMVTDVVMPGLNGFNLARMARMRRNHMKILYLSGSDEQFDALRDPGDRLGNLLLKPFTPADFRHEVDAALANRRVKRMPSATGRADE